jgi:hypothetical protein
VYPGRHGYKIGLVDLQAGQPFLQGLSRLAAWSMDGICLRLLAGSSASSPARHALSGFPSPRHAVIERGSAPARLYSGEMSPTGWSWDQLIIWTVQLANKDGASK